MKPGPEALPRLVIFDLDGVIHRGRQPVAGAAELTAALRRSGVLTRFATNRERRICGSLAGERRPGRIARDPADVACLLGLTLS